MHYFEKWAFWFKNIKKGAEGINLDFLKVCKQQVKRESVKKNPTHADAEVTYYETFCVQTWM